MNLAVPVENRSVFDENWGVLDENSGRAGLPAWPAFRPNIKFKQYPQSLSLNLILLSLPYATYRQNSDDRRATSLQACLLPDNDPRLQEIKQFARIKARQAAEEPKPEPRLL